MPEGRSRWKHRVAAALATSLVARGHAARGRTTLPIWEWPRLIRAGHSTRPGFCYAASLGRLREWGGGLALPTREDLPSIATPTKRGCSSEEPPPLSTIYDDLARYIEAELGRAPNVLLPDKLHQFTENDRKVLLFFCLQDDRDRRYGDRRPYVLHCFLGQESWRTTRSSRLEPNSGRDPFPVFLKRCRSQESTVAPGSQLPSPEGLSVTACHTVTVPAHHRRGPCSQASRLVRHRLCGSYPPPKRGFSSALTNTALAIRQVAGVHSRVWNSAPITGGGAGCDGSRHHERVSVRERRRGKTVRQ